MWNFTVAMTCTCTCSRPLMNKIELLAALHGLRFAEKQHYQYSFQTQHPRMLLDLTRLRCLCYWET